MVETSSFVFGLTLQQMAALLMVELLLNMDNFYIDNQTSQAQVTGIVDKEYKDNSHGAYQQMGIPFYKKNFSELSTELGANLSGNRWNRTGVLVWNNSKVRFDHFNPTNNTTDIKLAGHAVANNGATSYYAIGSRYFNALQEEHLIPYLLKFHYKRGAFRR